MSEVWMKTHDQLYGVQSGNGGIGGCMVIGVYSPSNSYANIEIKKKFVGVYLFLSFRYRFSLPLAPPRP